MRKCEVCGSTFQVQTYHLGIVDLTALCVQCAALGEREVCGKLGSPTFAEAMGVKDGTLPDQLETYSSELSGALNDLTTNQGEA